MTLFNQLKNQLKIQLDQIIEHKNVNNGLIILHAEQSCSIENKSLLSWLKAQNSYPKYYWQNRINTLTLTAIGSVKSFNNIQQAQQFSHKNHCTLVGGIPFSGEACFILPRLLLAKKEQKVTACLVIDGNHLIQEKTIIDTLFENFEQFAELEKIQCNLLKSMPYTNFEQWSKNIQNAIQHIEKGTFNKVVLANATDFICENSISAYDLLALSQQKNKHCFHFLWQETNEKAFMGSSPERLYKREQQQFYTEALAGTVAVTDHQKQTKENARWLLCDPKNNLENQYVVDDISENLNAYSHHITIGEPHLKRLPNVQHLRRLIEMELKENISDTECLQQIHPTAAVAGYPRNTAIPFILQTENFERNWYSGTLGFLNTEQAEFCVTLRSALIQQNKITVYAGAGIMRNSTPESEWQEIQHKALAMIKLLK
ncbi:isochorismate synthase [Pasteurella atlantica]|uniref:isochorismate synthase n=1 Tax=Pasteurellaceae TaxID=712 RepID=UPI00274BDEE2|nr:isochorismate synthase [Pasteurella atlantica]MDP8033862.1 isochorismate synthase [Pasteurella atlantica]MDP8035865.1 isochorismate synthase [Pasteurella atlantica]MDP8037796.1 isochorismate synthase [Pasteurella atlantica]MDP8048098.1 isochorismate synthase [Pasteurella atlantica]MDP8050188.1 isochorismate synthase [Pasteurella atlantica]